MSSELQTAQSDLSSLSRVSHKLVLTPDDRLDTVLEKLLPRILVRLGENHQLQLRTTKDFELKAVLDKIHAKLIEMLSHIIKRVRAAENCRLPCVEILLLLLQKSEIGPSIPKVNAQVDTLCLNLSLTFLTLGISRSSKEDLYQLLPGLLVLTAHYSGFRVLQAVSTRTQSHQIAHCLLKCIQQLVKDNVADHTPTTVVESNNQALALAKMTCAQEHVAAPIFDLFVDTILYQTVSGNIPPNGLSQAGHERLKAGSSTRARDWAAEMAVRSNLVDLKLAVLDFIAPVRRFGLFLYSDGDQWLASGLARTVAILVLVSGDPYSEVSERAQSYLKIHLDSFRGKSVENRVAFGDPLRLLKELLSLAVGGSKANSLIPYDNRGVCLPLGVNETDPGGELTQIYLSTKRRLLSETSLGTVYNYCSLRILDDDPRIFQDAPKETVYEVSSLAVLGASECLSRFGSSSGISEARAAPFIAAAQLLNSLVIRLSMYFDSTISNDCKVLLAKSMQAVCQVISGVTLQVANTNPSRSEGNIAVRDICYGVICTLCRSHFATANEMYLFTRGSAINNESIQSVPIDTASLLFGCTANEEERLRPRAVAALDALLGAYCRIYAQDELHNDFPRDTENPWLRSTTAATGPSQMPSRNSFAQQRDGLSRALLPLLWSASQRQPKSSHVAAARWASELVKQIAPVDACHLLLFLCGDDDVSAASIAREGMGLTNFEMTENPRVAESACLPEFSEIVLRLFPSQTEEDRTVFLSFRDFSSKGKAAALRFCLLCLMSDFYGGNHKDILRYLSALRETLLSMRTTDQQGHRDLFEEASVCFGVVLSTSKFARHNIIENSNKDFGMREIENLVLLSSSSKVRRMLACACGKLYEDVSPREVDDKCDDWFTDWVDTSGVMESLSLCLSAISDLSKAIYTPNRHGALFLGAHIIRVIRKHFTSFKGAVTMEYTRAMKVVAKFLEETAQNTSHVDDMIGNSCADSLSIALSYESSDCPLLESDLHAPCATVLLSLASSLSKYGGTDYTDSGRAAKVAVAAGNCLGATSAWNLMDVANSYSQTETNRGAVGAARLQCVNSLFQLLGSAAYQKDEEIGLVIGEALAAYSDAFSPPNIIWNSFSTEEWPDSYDENFASTLPPHAHTLYILLRRELRSSSPQRRTSVGPALLAIVARAAQGIIINHQSASRSLAKLLLSRIYEVQLAFISILSDPKCKQLSRESCCLGLAACRRLVAASDCTESSGAARLNDQLLRAFGQTTVHAGSAFMESRAQAAERRAANEINRDDRDTQNIMEPFGAEDEVGGTAGLSEASLGAYREMAAASISIGRNDALYGLLVMSVSHSVWYTEENRDKYSSTALLEGDALFGHAGNLTELRNALKPHLGKLIPRLLRACHDPNKQTREQMYFLWESLTGGGADARLLVGQYFLSTFDELTKDATSKLWRARVGACGALSEIITGRTWQEMGGGEALLSEDIEDITPSAAVRLIRLYRVTMRSLDDIRGSVREAGEKLGRSVRSLTIRLCDPSSNKETDLGVKRGRSETEADQHDLVAAAATSLHWLTVHGLNQQCVEATGLCISTLVNLVEVVNSATIAPILPKLVRSLLLCMSGLEPAALSYLQLRASNDNAHISEGFERARLQLAQSGPLAAAVAKCLDLVPSIDEIQQKTLVHELDSALRLSVGIATRAATADAVSALCNSCPNAFRFPSLLGASNPTVRLLRALYFAMERERSSAVRDKFCHSFGNLAALCPGGSVRSLALRACKRYTSSTGSNDDPVQRKASASALRAIAVRAPEHFADGGPADIWCLRILPIAYLGRHDADAKIASLWNEVWEEGGGIANSSGSIRKFSSIRLEENILSGLVTACVESLRDVSWSRRVAGAAALSDLQGLGILCPLHRNDPLSISTTTLERAKIRAQCCYDAISACVDLLVKPRLWTGKHKILATTGKLVSAWIGVDLMSGNVLGWGERNTQCPWLPVTFYCNGRDLFSNDGWFATHPIEVDSFEPEPYGEPFNGESEIEKDAIIDFKECDTTLDEDDAPLESNKNTKIDSRSVVFQGFCHLLIQKGLYAPSGSDYLSDELLVYRTTAFQVFRDLTEKLDDNNRTLKKAIAEDNMSELLRLIDDWDLVEPPVILAHAIQCTTSCLHQNVLDDASTSALSTSLSNRVNHSAWSVREAALLGLAQLVRYCDASSMQSARFISSRISSVEIALQDLKFWRVRLAGLKLLEQLLRRVDDKSSGGRNSLMLDVVLPHKEEVNQMLRKCLRDPQPEVTSVSSALLCLMSWWP